MGDGQTLPPPSSGSKHLGCMTPDRWKSIKQILERALELPAGERPALVAELCEGDSELVAEVMAMLEFENEDSLEIPAAESSGFSSQGLQSGYQIGIYRIVRELG